MQLLSLPLFFPSQLNECRESQGGEWVVEQETRAIRKVEGIGFKESAKSYFSEISSRILWRDFKILSILRNLRNCRESK